MPLPEPFVWLNHISRFDYPSRKYLGAEGAPLWSKAIHPGIIRWANQSVDPTTIITHKLTHGESREAVFRLNNASEVVSELGINHTVVDYVTVETTNAEVEAQDCIVALYPYAMALEEEKRCVRPVHERFHKVHNSRKRPYRYKDEPANCNVYRECRKNKRIWKGDPRNSRHKLDCPVQNAQDLFKKGQVCHNVRTEFISKALQEARAMILDEDNKDLLIWNTEMAMWGDERSPREAARRAKKNADRDSRRVEAYRKAKDKADKARAKADDALSKAITLPLPTEPVKLWEPELPERPKKSGKPTKPGKPKKSGAPEQPTDPEESGEPEQ